MAALMLSGQSLDRQTTATAPSPGRNADMKNGKGVKRNGKGRDGIGACWDEGGDVRF